MDAPSRTDLLRQILTFSAIEFVSLAHAGSIIEANRSFARRMGTSAQALAGRPVAELMTDADAVRVLAWAAGEDPPVDDSVLLNFVPPSNEPYTLRCVIHRDGERLLIIGEVDGAGDAEATAQLLRVNNEFATLTREVSRKSRELERVNEGLAQALRDLETSHWHLKKIQEVLPLCMECGKVKGDGSTWAPVIDYLKSNDIFLSHGYCPVCAERIMAEMDRSEQQ